MNFILNLQQHLRSIKIFKEKNVNQIFLLKILISVPVSVLQNATEAI